jgi:hydrogenase expression/formation protein HypC
MCLGVPAEVVEVRGDSLLDRTATVSVGGALREVLLAGAPEAVPGDFVIVHAGFAISRIDPEEAAELAGYLSRISRLSQEDGP